jgi:hypothetical protein
MLTHLLLGLFKAFPGVLVINVPGSKNPLCKGTLILFYGMNCCLILNSKEKLIRLFKNKKFHMSAGGSSSVVASHGKRPWVRSSA